MRLCELCGQPTVRENPRLCAECYYRYWYLHRKIEPLEKQGTAIKGKVG